jgi:hypothetical protein
VFEVPEFDPSFGQVCGGVVLLGVVVVEVVVPVLRAFDFELLLAAANATPPPASVAVTTASARMRLSWGIRLLFDAGHMRAVATKVSLSHSCASAEARVCREAGRSGTSRIDSPLADDRHALALVVLVGWSFLPGHADHATRGA